MGRETEEDGKRERVREEDRERGKKEQGERGGQEKGRELADRSQDVTEQGLPDV